jgi:hypothetical protein
MRFSGRIETKETGLTGFSGGSDARLNLAVPHQLSQLVFIHLHGLTHSPPRFVPVEGYHPSGLIVTQGTNKNGLQE